MSALPSLRVRYLPWMQDVAESPERHKFVSGARGILKTTFAYQWLTVDTLRAKRQGIGVFTAPTYRMAKRIVWEPLNRWLEDQDERVKLSENSADLTIKLVDNKGLMLLGMDQFEGLRGIHPISNANDEVARSKMTAFQEVLDPALASHRANTLDVTTPRGKGGWYHRWKRGWGENPEEDCRSWMISAAEVGMISPKDLGEFQERMSEALFRQEWCGEFTGAEGPVFPEFIDKPWPEGHLVAPGLVRREMERGGFPLGALDWAYTGQAVLLWGWMTRRGGVIVYDEMVVSRKTPSQMMTTAKARRALPPVIALDHRCWGAESDGRDVASQIAMAARGSRPVRIVQADKRFAPSIVKLNELMTITGDEDFPRFAIQAGTCPKLCVELRELQEEDLSPTQGGFRNSAPCDSTDALRYLAMATREGAPSYEPTVNGDVPSLRRIRGEIGRDRITGFHAVSGRPLFSGEDDG